MPRWLLAILRIHLGVILLLTVAGKLTRTATFADEMVAVLRAFRSTSAPYRHFLDSVVLAHAALFSRLVISGELFAALSLLTGTFTRLGAAVAMFLFLNCMLAKGRVFWSPDSQDAAVFFEAQVVCLGAAGRALGVDALLARRRPRSILW